jgi:hypothetical protein
VVSGDGLPGIWFNVAEGSESYTNYAFLNGGSGVTELNGASSVLIKVANLPALTAASGGVTTLIMNGQITWANIGATQGLLLYNGGAGSNYGLGIIGGVLQSFVPSGARFSWNLGGTLNAVGTNELARLNATGFAIAEGAVIGFDGGTAGTMDSGISRLAAGSLAIGDGAAGDTTGNLSYNRVNLAGADYAGTVTITAAATTQAVSYAANYTGTAAPVVVATPTSDPLALGVPVGYWVTPTGGAGAWTGFTMNIQTALAGNVTFNYIVVGKA